MYLCVELASEVMSRQIRKICSGAVLRLLIVVEPPSTGQDLSGGTIQGTIGESVLETGGRSDRCSLRNLMASSRFLC
jgi:hypothetical protein